MRNTTSFLKFAAFSGLLSVITTLGIHLAFPEYSPEFVERLQLYRNSVYIFNRWWIILHCLLVITSMWGFFIVQFNRSPAFAGLGFIFFVVFGVTEIARQIFILFYLNGLRIKYLAADSQIIREILKIDIDNFNLIGNSLFGLFILSIALGNLFYGLSLWNESGFAKILSWLFVIWFIGNVTGLQLEFTPNETVSYIMGIFSYIYQPIMRFLISCWLWQQSSESNT